MTSATDGVARLAGNVLSRLGSYAVEKSRFWIHARQYLLFDKLMTTQSDDLHPRLFSLA